MKIEIARYVAKCDTCQRVKAVHLKSVGPLNPLPVPSWKWDDISMDFFMVFPRHQKVMIPFGSLLIASQR
jgi:hypothetical protein